MDLCAPCERYQRAEWGRNLGLEACCLNCRYLEDAAPCSTLKERLYPECPARQPVRLQVVRGGDNE